MQSRIDAETDPDENRELWTATKILMGLRFPPAVTDELLKGVRHMRESATYQAILEEGRSEGEARGRVEGEARGRADEARRLLVLAGQGRLHSPSPETRAKIDAITPVERLEELIQRVYAVATWDDLLAD